MPPPEDLTAIWARARAGDRAAADDLARAVLPWTLRTAWNYARLFGLYRDDLYSEGLTAFPAALRSFDPARGGFLNYFAACAGRAMVRAGRRAVDSPERPAGRSRGSDADGPLDRVPARDGDDARHRRVLAVADVLHELAARDEMALAVLAMAAGLLAGCRKADARTIAREYGLAEADVLAAYRRADAAVRAALDRADP
jgi:hypothetical protein